MARSCTWKELQVRLPSTLGAHRWERDTCVCLGGGGGVRPCLYKSSDGAALLACSSPPAPPTFWGSCMRCLVSQAGHPGHLHAVPRQLRDVKRLAGTSQWPWGAKHHKTNTIITQCTSVPGSANRLHAMCVGVIHVVFDTPDLIHTQLERLQVE